MRECQPTFQWGDREGDQVRVIRRTLPFLRVEIVDKPEVLEIWKEPDEVQDLPGSAYGVGEEEGLNSQRKVPEVLLDVWHKSGYVEIVYSERPDVPQRGKVTQGTSVKPVGGERGTGRLQVDTKFFDERK